MSEVLELRVLKPLTSDGVTLKYDRNNQPMMKEIYYPISAKKHLESINRRLLRNNYPHLVMKIEQITPVFAEPEEAPKIAFTADQAELIKKTSKKNDKTLD